MNREAVAIVGMACLFPKAPDIKSFWHNILASVDAICEPLPEWEADRYLSSGRIKTAFGGYLKELYRFDPGEFGIMPNSVDGGEPDQFLALRIARDALQDAGYLGPDHDHRDTGIVLGHSNYLHKGQGNLIQHHIVMDQTLELLKSLFPSLDAGRLSKLKKYLQAKLPQCNADSAPGVVPNVMTGRIANRLNFKGPNYLIDAACSSSLLAVGAAIDELRSGRSRMMLAGGVNGSLPAEASVIFTQLGALSESGRIRPFAEDSDGTLLAEGIGVVVLKRVSDAIADKDRIYALIRGVGQASDGRGQGLLAPSVEGEALAIERAYSSSRVDPSSIELIEAHGTGIPLGDRTEITALKKIFGERKSERKNIAIGSVKSMIGHCIPAAGIASLIKSALALHHKILPPTICETVSSELDIENSPFYINTAAKPWISRPCTPRRVGINSFGFGGINAHAILEEAPAQAPKSISFTPWPYALCVFSAANINALSEKLDEVVNLPGKNAKYGADDIAAMLADQDTGGTCRLAMVVKGIDDLETKIRQAQKRFCKNPETPRWATRNGVVYSRRPLEGKLAFMFPGEGSQYTDMFADLAMCFDDVRAWFDFWRGLYDDLPGENRIDIVFSPPGGREKNRRKKSEKRLQDMDVGSEAVFIGSRAMLSLLYNLEIKPDAMVGHSTGESTALTASGAIDSEDKERLADFIRELNAVYKRVLDEGKIPTGALLSVGALSHKIIEEHIAASKEEIAIAMDNCPNQVVLFGNKDSIESIQKTLVAAGGICIPLPFDRGYHTPRFAAVSEAFFDYYDNICLHAPRVPLYSCATAALFPEDKYETRKLASNQWSKKVRFRETIRAMHRDGVRYFIEVGPSGNLTSFVNDILAGEEYLSLATDLRRKNDVQQFLTVLAHLYVNRKDLRLDRLFDSRMFNPVDKKGGGKGHRQSIHLDNTMPVLHLDSQADRDFLAGLVANRKKIDSDALHTPFLTAVVKTDRRHLQADCRLGVHKDNFLRDHVLSGAVSETDPDLVGLSCIPLAVSLEIMAEACVLLAEEPFPRVIENVKALNWLALDYEELTLNVEAKLIDPNRKTYSARIVNDGTVAVSADFSFKEDWSMEGLFELAEMHDSVWNGDELYSTGMFHGPIFQSILRINGWNRRGIDAALSPGRLDGFFEEGKIPDFALNPVLLDAAGQLSAYWIAQQIGTNFNSFPSTIKRIEIYRQCPENLPGLTMRARQRTIGRTTDDFDMHGEWQFECLDNEERPLFRAVGLENIFFHVPNRFCEFRRDPLYGWLGELVESVGNDDSVVLRFPHFSEEFCSQSGGIFMRILAHGLLSSDERCEWRDLPGNVRQRSQWLFEKACVKEAVRLWIYRQMGYLVFPSDIEVLHGRQGTPYVDGWWRTEIIRPPEVTAIRNDRFSICAAASHSFNLESILTQGIEQLEKKR